MQHHFEFFVGLEADQEVRVKLGERIDLQNGVGSLGSIRHMDFTLINNISPLV